MEPVESTVNGRTVRILTLAAVIVLVAGAVALATATGGNPRRITATSGSTTTGPPDARHSSELSRDGSGVGDVNAGLGDVTIPTLGPAPTTPGTIAPGHPGATTTQPPSQPGSSVPSPGGTATVHNLTQGGRVVKGSSSHSTQTDSVSPTGSGTVFVWVINLVGGDVAAPVPSVSGLGLSWTMVETVQKKDDAPRRYTVFGAQYAAPPAPGPLTIGFGGDLDSSTLAWVVMQVNRTHIVQTAEYGIGGFETSFEVSFATPPRAGSVTIAGFGMGQNDPIRAGSGLVLVGHGTGPSPPSSSFVEWSPHGAGRLDCTWDTPAHAMAIALELA